MRKKHLFRVGIFAFLALVTLAEAQQAKKIARIGYLSGKTNWGNDSSVGFVSSGPRNQVRRYHR